ncbi:MAG: sortase, partial [Caldilineaceae bacterium SB0670_bin_27]|nr:sortase [Caldilineaceae bacterium SB0670_bin_27]
MRLTLSLSTLALLVLLFGGCGNRSAAATATPIVIATDSSIGAPTDTSPPSSVAATAPAAADPTP